MKAKGTSPLLLIVSLVLASCTTSTTRELSTPTATPEVGPGVPNPASVFCAEHGGQLDIRTGDDGGQVGYCVFPNGSECEEWAFYRGECAPEEIEPTPIEETDTPIVDTCVFTTKNEIVAYQRPNLQAEVWTRSLHISVPTYRRRFGVHCQPVTKTSSAE